MRTEESEGMGLDLCATSKAPKRTVTRACVAEQRIGAKGRGVEAARTPRQGCCEMKGRGQGGDRGSGFPALSFAREVWADMIFG